jgi:hypothetical protein
MSKTRCPRRRGRKDDLSLEKRPRRSPKNERWTWDRLDPTDLDITDIREEDLDVEFDEELLDLLAEGLDSDEYCADDSGTFKE